MKLTKILAEVATDKPIEQEIDLPRTIRFYLKYGVSCAEELYKRTLSLQQLEIGYREKRANAELLRRIGDR